MDHNWVLDFHVWLCYYALKGQKLDMIIIYILWVGVARNSDV